MNVSSVQCNLKTKATWGFCDGKMVILSLNHQSFEWKFICLGQPPHQAVPTSVLNISLLKVIQGNFYVDNGLVSITSDAEAIQLIKEARELCCTGKLRLHKFISNINNVLKSIPREECAESVKDLHMALGKPLMERAIGVHWCVSCSVCPPGKTDFATDVSRQGWLEWGTLWRAQNTMEVMATRPTEIVWCKEQKVVCSIQLHKC